jgi:hypothetical protein
MEDVDIFYGHWVHFTIIWYTYVIGCIFPRFGILHQEKSCTLLHYIKAVLLLSFELLVNIGVNPTIVSFNASAVKIYNATSSLVCFENKIFLL